jgi:hypothetical protein
LQKSLLIPLAVVFCQIAAPSAVRQIEKGCDWQSGAADAALRRRPFVLSANETSMLSRPVGTERSTQVSPRSDERKRRVPATSAQTTVPDGALSCAMVGSVIGDGDAVGEFVGVWVGVGDADAEGVGDVAALG